MIVVDLIGDRYELKVDTDPQTVRIMASAPLGERSLVHGTLLDRDVPDQHPVSAITGLQNALDGKAPLSHSHAGEYEPAGTAASAVAAHAAEEDPHGMYLESDDLIGGQGIVLDKSLPGRIVFSAGGSETLGGLADVDAPAPADGSALVYSTADSVWQPTVQPVTTQAEMRVCTLAEYTALDSKTGLYLVKDETGALSLYALDSLVWSKPSPWPNADTTGVPAGTALTLLTTANSPNPSDTFPTAEKFIVNTANAVFNGWIFDRWVEVRAVGVQFINCKFVGPATIPADVALLRVQAGVRSATATRCTFEPVAVLKTDAVRGSNVTVDRCNISKTVDGVHVFGNLADRGDPNAGNVVVKDSWIHDLTWFPDAAYAIAGTHNDCVQIVGGTNIQVLRNRFSGAVRNAGIQITQAVHDVNGVVISGNLFEQSSVSGVNCDDKGSTTHPVGLTMTNNQFKKTLQTYPMVVTPLTENAPGTIISGNVWTDGSAPPPSVS